MTKSDNGRCDMTPGSTPAWCSWVVASPPHTNMWPEKGIPQPLVAHKSFKKIFKKFHLEIFREWRSLLHIHIFITFDYWNLKCIQSSGRELMLGGRYVSTDVYCSSSVTSVSPWFENYELRYCGSFSNIFMIQTADYWECRKEDLFSFCHSPKSFWNDKFHHDGVQVYVWKSNKKNKKLFYKMELQKLHTMVK